MQILPANEISNSNEEISRVFVEGFFPLLKMLCKDKTKLTKALAHALRREQFFVALEDGRVVGIAACADGRTSSLWLDQSQLKRHLGWLRGELAYRTMHPEVDIPHYPVPIESGVGAIENVAVDPDYRRRGVARALLSHIFAETPCGSYILEVADSNAKAIALYESFGFREVKRVPQKYARFTGINEYLYMVRPDSLLGL